MLPPYIIEQMQRDEQVGLAQLSLFIDDDPPPGWEPPDPPPDPNAVERGVVVISWDGDEEDSKGDNRGGSIPRGACYVF
jgi:hypothetical protein